MTYARPVTPELYAGLIEDLEALKAERNPWAASWLQILDTLEEANRAAVLAALISGLPALYRQMRDLGNVALKAIAFDVTYTPDPIVLTDLDALEDVYVPPKPSSVPDELGALFPPIIRPVPTTVEAGLELIDKTETELRRVRDNVRRRLAEHAAEEE